MRSLLISHRYFPPHVGGITRMMDRLAHELGESRVCCLTAQPANGLPAGTAGPRVYRSAGLFLARTKIARGIAWATTVPRIFIREHPGVILLGTIADAAYAGRLKNWMGRPTVTMVYGNELLEALAGAPGSSSAARALRNSDHVIAISRFTAGLAERAGVSRDRITVIYPGCDAAEFSPRAPNPELRDRLLGATPGAKVILTTGNLVTRKGHDMVIRALSRVRERVGPVTYLIVGDGPARGDLERLARETGVRDRVVFAGQVADEALADYYALCDVFVMPSRERPEECDVEGFGIVYLEANACGKPVVGGRSGGVPEAVVHGETGMLVDPENPEDVANTIIDLLQNPDRAARMGQNGRARVLSEFGWDRVANRVHTVLVSVAGRQGP